MPSRRPPLVIGLVLILASSGYARASIIPGARDDRPRELTAADSVNAALLADSLRVALAAAPVPEAGRALEIVYEGTLELEGHYRRPGDKKTFHSIQRFLSSGRGASLLDWTTWSEGDSARVPERFLLVGDSVFHRAAPEAPWRLRAGSRGDLARAQVLAGLPWDALRDVEGSLRRDAQLVSDPPGWGETVWTVTNRAVDAAWHARRIGLHPHGSGLSMLTTRRAHPRLGDVEDGFRYTYGDGGAPTRLVQELHERDHQWSLTARRTSFRTDAEGESDLAAPAVFEPEAPESGALAPAPAPILLAPGVWSLDLEDVESRSLIVEFRDHLALIEAAVSSANGERIVDAIHRHWPEKPIKHVFFSHHHPHYAGGLRALMAEGATVVATPGNAPFVRGVHALPFGIRPDRLADRPRKLKLKTFQGRFELSDATNRLVAVDIGSRSDHTEEFVVFWLPRAGIVFETEQGWATVDGSVRASRRAARFLETLAEEGIVADRLVQSWPMRGNRAELSRVELETLVRDRAAGP